MAAAGLLSCGGDESGSDNPQGPELGVVIAAAKSKGLRFGKEPKIKLISKKCKCAKRSGEYFYHCKGKMRKYANYVYANRRDVRLGIRINGRYIARKVRPSKITRLKNHKYKYQIKFNKQDFRMPKGPLDRFMWVHPIYSYVISDGSGAKARLTTAKAPALEVMRCLICYPCPRTLGACIRATCE